MQNAECCNKCKMHNAKCKIRNEIAKRDGESLREL